MLADLDLPRITPNTITDRDGFLAELATVREQGWAHDREENEPSINCIGAPVRSASGRAVAAVSVSVPDIVAGYDELLDAAARAARGHRTHLPRLRLAARDHHPTEEDSPHDQARP